MGGEILIVRRFAVLENEPFDFFFFFFDADSTDVGIFFFCFFLALSLSAAGVCDLTDVVIFLSVSL